MFALVRQRGPHRCLRRRSTPAFTRLSPMQGPPGRLDFDDEAIELIGPGNERAGDGT